jgi:hypothetical protein
MKPIFFELMNASRLRGFFITWIAKHNMDSKTYASKKISKSWLAVNKAHYQ